VGGGQQYNLQQDTDRACGITDPGSDNTIILTGGYGPINTVAIYGYNGFIGALPSLEIARRFHGCGVEVQLDPVINLDLILLGTN
ncbi:MAG: hypothetical protein CMO44_15545, partial [Verrucomicrobiales bacterium]|nr:hypothetical protein [Verrucomicrobiales bacterium]